MGFGYITDSSYSRIVTVPFSLPQTRLRAGTSVIVASVRCNLGSILRLHVLNFHVVQLLTALTEEVTTTVTSDSTVVAPFTYASHSQAPTPQVDYSLAINGLGLGYAGVFASDFSAIRQPTGTPLALTVAPDVGIYALNAHNRYDFSGPDVYHVVATNNTDNLDLGVVVTGAFRVYNLIQSSYQSTLDGNLVTTSNACACCSISNTSTTPNQADVGNPVVVAPVGNVTVYYSAAQTASCPSGTVGDAVTIPAAALVNGVWNGDGALSTISQLDANTQALALATSGLVCNLPGTPPANDITTTTTTTTIGVIVTPTELADGTAAGICESALP